MKYIYNTDDYLYDEYTTKRILENLKKNFEICKKIKNLSKELTANSPWHDIFDAASKCEQYSQSRLDNIIKQLEVIKKRQDKNLEKSKNRK